MDEKIPYLIIGGGHLAKHLSAYFNLLGVRYLQWTKAEKNELDGLVDRCDKLLVAIPDDSLENFISELRQKTGSGKIIIHFSGAHEIPGAESAHPLMTFSGESYSLAEYISIPFVTVKGRLSFNRLFPELPNKAYEISLEDKALYHALLTVAGNFPTILWQLTEELIGGKLGLPKIAIEPFLRKTIDNYFKEENSLTGPFARRDFKTIQKHTKALNGTKLSDIYSVFFNTYFKGELK